MSIEKIDFLQVRQEKKSFTTALNSVLQNLRDATALGLWVYLSSLPEGWLVNKEHLRRHFDLGRDKLDSVLLYLKQNGLIEIGQERLSDGTMSKGYINVKCGYDFIKDCNFNDQSYSQKQPHPEKPLTAQPDTAKPGHGKSAPINKIINTNKIKRESGSLSDFEPNEENKNLALELNVDIEVELISFKEKHSGKGNLEKEFKKWLELAKEYKNRKKNKQIYTKEEIIRPKYRDFTQERLDREALQES